ncbi:MAG TPA: GIY-YIG nuclease family protein [Bacteroidota bacterium]|nr:GIY-YIG nuclease family protein [Bacteroidota bacterium]
MIKLTDILFASHISLKMDSYKIHLATGSKSSPLNAFFAGKFKEWQESQNRKNFKKDMVIGLIELKRNTWLFAGVYKILGYKKRGGTRVTYSTELLSGQEDLIGRVIVYHERVGRASYLNGAKYGDDFIVSEIREKKLTLSDFPGYYSVILPHEVLKAVIDQHVPSWHGALSNIKGVYLILDTLCGKVYVGSATGNSGIWQRWSGYAHNGHGNNKELKALLSKKKTGYQKNFQYSILEIADFHASDDDILKRESYWKKVMKSREFGYNKN